MAAPTALQYPLLLFFKFSCISVYKSMRIGIRNLEKNMITVLFRNASDRYCAPFSSIKFLSRFSDLSDYENIIQTIFTKELNHESQLLYYFVMHLLDILHLYHQFHYY